MGARDSAIAAMLRRVPWMSALGARSIDELARASTKREARRGEVLARAGETSPLFLVITATIEVQRASESGRRRTFRQLGSGELVGVSLVGGAVHTADLVVSAPGSVAVIPLEAVRAVLLREPEAALKAIARMGELLGDSSEALASRDEDPLEARVMGALKRLARGTRELRLTHEALATLVGASRESVSRCLKALERAGSVKLGRGRVELV